MPPKNTSVHPGVSSREFPYLPLWIEEGLYIYHLLSNILKGNKAKNYIIQRRIELYLRPKKNMKNYYIMYMLYISFDRVAHLFESSHTFRYRSILVCTDIDGGICHASFLLVHWHLLHFSLNISLLHLLHR